MFALWKLSSNYIVLPERLWKAVCKYLWTFILEYRNTLYQSGCLPIQVGAERCQVAAFDPLQPASLPGSPWESCSAVLQVFHRWSTGRTGRRFVQTGASDWKLEPVLLLFTPALYGYCPHFLRDPSGTGSCLMAAIASLKACIWKFCSCGGAEGSARSSRSAFPTEHAA